MEDINVNHVAEVTKEGAADSKCQDHNQETNAISEDRIGRPSEISITRDEQVKEVTLKTTMNQIENSVSGARKISEPTVENQGASTKKSKAASKPNQKHRTTVPQPFSLATDKRMSRERRGTVDQPSKSQLSKKSTSLRTPSKSSERTIQSSSVRIVQSTDMRLGKSSAESIKQISESKEKRVKSASETKRTENKDRELKKPNAMAKEEEASGPKKFRKSSTFKASPLPNLRSQKAHPKPEIKRVTLTSTKSSVLAHQRSKSMIEIGTIKAESSNSTIRKTLLISESKNKKPEISCSTSKKVPSVALPGNNKPATTKKSLPKTISGSAKETISRLLTGSWKAPRAKRNEAMTGASCADEMQKEAPSKGKEGNVLLLQ